MHVLGWLERSQVMGWCVISQEGKVYGQDGGNRLQIWLTGVYLNGKSLLVRKKIAYPSPFTPVYLLRY